MKRGLGDPITDSPEDTTRDSSKRVKQDAPAPFNRGVSFLLVDSGKPHRELGKGIKVRLRPWITTETIGKTINRIAINGRTPSPFGKAMGDHTVAWQVVVDEIHARLYGLTLDAAMSTLREEHSKASEWMKKRGTPGKLLLRELDDIASRWLRLEDATYHVNRHLTAGMATGANADLKRRRLTLALSHHLAYVNYLPFETVPAKSAIGSHGSAEGTHRATLVNYEKGRRKARIDAQAVEASKSPLPLDPVPQVSPVEAERVRAEAEKARVEAEKARIALVKPELLKSIWTLFDFKAALRESHLEYALLGSIVTNASDSYDATKAQYDRLKVIALEFQAGKFAEDALKNLGDIRDKAIALHRGATYVAFRYAAGLVRDSAKDLGDTLAEGTRRKKSVGKRIANDDSLSGAVDDANQTLTEIRQRAATAPDRAARVLSALLRRHLTALAAAYPNTVRDTGLLLTTPAASAYAKLAAVVQETDEYKAGGTAAVKVLTDLKDPFIAYFGDAAIAIAASDEWIVDAGNSGLVVTWNPTGRMMDVNGRAPAPEGVQGMGSHTTAWVLECLALNAIIGGVTDAADIISNLRDAVIPDLGGKIIKLDELLPAAQLEGNQLFSLFKAAADVLGTNPQTGQEAAEAAARSYLEFRNLLPFATVDEGNRGGHSESAEASMKDLFDQGSLTQAVTNIADALKDAKRAQEIATALGAAAKTLRDEVGSEDNKWPDQVKEAATASASRLAKRSRNLGRAIADKALDENDADRAAKRIMDTREAEHRKVFRLARPS